MEILYKNYKNKLAKNKQKEIETTIELLKDIKDRDLTDKIQRELINKFIEISYNYRHTILKTSLKNYKVIF